MPSPDTILIGLTETANDWRWLSIVWHLLLAALLASGVAGWRPSIRLLGYLLVGPIASVGLVAWLAGNPFNGAIFVGIAATLLWSSTRFSKGPLRLGSPALVTVGVSLVTFGLTYPHFLRAASWTAYLYAAPFGLVPCPTIAVAIGMTLLFRNFGTPSWNVVLTAAAVLYGAIGVFRLGVTLDWGLLFAAATLAVVQRDAAAVSGPVRRHVW